MSLEFHIGETIITVYAIKIPMMSESLLLLSLLLVVLVIKALNMRSTLIVSFYKCNVVLLPIGIMILS